MVSIDLEDVYLQVPIHPDSRKYLSFSHGSWLRSRPFCIPWVFACANTWTTGYPGTVSLSGSPGSGDGHPSLSGFLCRHHLGAV